MLLYVVDWFTSYLKRALIPPYHNHLLLLLIYVVLRALWKIDVHLISTLVNKSLYYYKKKSLYYIHAFSFWGKVTYRYIDLQCTCIRFYFKKIN